MQNTPRSWTFLPKAILVVALGLTTLVGLTVSADVVTDPVGFYKIVAQTNADTYTSVPFTRMPESSGAVQSVAANVITASGTPGWTSSEWVFPATSPNDGTVSNTYYVVMTTGNKKGAYYKILANDPTTLTVELIPEDLTSAPAVGAGDTFRIIPFWTLNTVWPNGQGVTPSPGTTTGNRRTQVVFPAIGGVGFNLAPTVTFYFLQSASAGTNWAITTGGNYNHQIILPDQYVIVRQPVSVVAPSTNTTLGQVSMYNWRIPLYGTNSQQDSYIGLPRPAVATLYDLGFTNNNNANGFLPSPGTTSGNRRDTLLTLDNTSQGQNKAPVSTYYMLNSGQWRITTDSGTDQGNITIFQPGQAFIIRKFSTNTTQTIWSEAPNYSN